MQQMLQIEVLMNENTKILLETDVKQNRKVRDNLENFAMRTLKKRGYANFVFDDTVEDKCVIFKIGDTEETVKLK